MALTARKKHYTHARGKRKGIIFCGKYC